MHRQRVLHAVVSVVALYSVVTTLLGCEETTIIVGDKFDIPILHECTHFLSICIPIACGLEDILKLTNKAALVHDGDTFPLANTF